MYYCIPVNLSPRCKNILGSQGLKGHFTGRAMPLPFMGGERVKDLLLYPDPCKRFGFICRSERIQMNILGIKT